jgi:peroxiredoxin Q/BCP
VAVASVSTSEAASLNAFAQTTQIPFPLLPDPDRVVIRAYGVYQFLSFESFRMARPSSFLIDRSGRIRFCYVGSNQWDRPAPEVLLAEAATL